MPKAKHVSQNEAKFFMDLHQRVTMAVQDPAYVGMFTRGNCGLDQVQGIPIDTIEEIEAVRASFEMGRLYERMGLLI